MGIGNMRYKDLLKKVPDDVEVEIENRNGESIIRINKKVSKKEELIPSMF